MATYGTPGNDIIFGDTSDATIFGGEGADTITGDNFAEALYGNQGNDSLQGGGGADTLYGGQNNDTVKGNEGDDILYGNLGNDSLEGNTGNDYLHGGQGNDTLNGGAGNDQLLGQLGNNRFVFEDDAGHDTIHGYVHGADRIEIERGINDLPITTAADVLARVSYSGGNAVISIDQQTSITLLNIAPGTLTLDDFLVS